MVNNYKKVKKLSIIILTSAIVIILATLNIIGSDPGKKNIRRFITNHYTVTSEELDSYKKYNNGDSKELLTVRAKKIEEMSMFFTEKGLNSYKDNGIPVGRLVQPFAEDYTIAVKEIKLKLKGMHDKGLLTYDTTFTIVKKNRKDGNETSEIVNKTFYLSKENNQWKINEFNRFY